MVTTDNVKIERSAQSLALRMDDVGASTKRYNVYARKDLRLGRVIVPGDFLFIKYLPSFKGWGPYPELTCRQWEEIFELLDRHNARMTVAVTAAWAVSEKRLIPFPKKFPGQARLLREAALSGRIEIANHGLSHCVLGGNAFKPRLFSPNRYWHREFWSWLDPQTHYEHVRQSQQILQDWLGMNVVTLTPPGHTFSEDTLVAAEQNGISYVSCNTETKCFSKLLLLGESRTIPFHDRDLALHGTAWLGRRLEEHAGTQLVTVKDLGVELRHLLRETS